MTTTLRYSKVNTKSKSIFFYRFYKCNSLDSFREVENTVSHMNSVVQEQEVTQMMINLQNSLVDHVPKIIKPSKCCWHFDSHEPVALVVSWLLIALFDTAGRKIIKEGVLQKMSSSGVTLKRYCVLMSDIFMYCKILKVNANQSWFEFEVNKTGFVHRIEIRTPS